MISGSGVKLLDFGLAKALDNGSEKSITGSNMLLGTLAYMAPEQLDGKPADKRSDIFSFGSVLHEMITGRRAFVGDNTAQLAVAIASKDPDAIGNARDPLAHLIQRCLMKDPEERWQTARDLMLELEWIGENSDTGTIRTTAVLPGKSRGWIAWAAAAALASALVLAWTWRRQESGSLTRFQVASPGQSLMGMGSFALSPDGKGLVFSARDENGSRLWLRSLDALAAKPLAGTDGADLDNPPFWSPDGKNIAFFAGGSLKRVVTGGGTAHTLCAAPQARGGAWGGDTILFSPAVNGGLFKVPASGGEVTRVTELRSDIGEINHRLPSFLPDGQHCDTYSCLPVFGSYFTCTGTTWSVGSTSIH